jgi:glucokinase
MFGIGIDLGGTQIKGAAFNLDTGELLHRHTVPTRDGDHEGGHPAWATATAGLIEHLETQLPHPAAAIGLSSPGLADPDHHCIRYLPNRLHGLENFIWADFLHRPQVTVLNDAHAALLGEIWKGAAQDVQNAILLTLGTGVGGAIVAGGKPFTGTIGRAGHFGHSTVNFRGTPDICHTPGSLEDAVGQCTLPERSNGRFTRTDELLKAVQAGDTDAAQVWQTSIEALAAAIASFINILDPEVVLLGGGISVAGELLTNPLSEALDRFEWRPGNHTVPVRTTTLGEWAGTYGSAHFAHTVQLQQSNP